ncbi:MAG: Txe/YoeB family addiction module toxin [Flavobacteriales bacterium]
MNISFTPKAWEDYQYWMGQDKKKVVKINQLLKDILRNPFEGIGMPEPLKFQYSGFWSRRIDQTHRLVYKVDANQIIVVKCRYHYDD